MVLGANNLENFNLMNYKMESLIRLNDKTKSRNNKDR